MFCFLFFFKTVRNVSKLRGDGQLENLETMPDDTGYHRRCYSCYTNTKSLPKSQAMLHQPLLLREGRPNQVH